MLEVADLSKVYETPAGAIRPLSAISFSLDSGESASVVGPSGSGKSTLLYVLGALEPPTSGNVRLDGLNPFELADRELARFRNTRVGFVFQDHHLLPQLSVIENVLLPTLVDPARDGAAEAWAHQLVDAVGLRSRAHHRPHQLSGGEKQRAALARALVRKPRLLLCDEPTGNLDSASGGAVSDLLLDLHRQQQSILIVVTHNPDLAARFSRRFRLSAARLEPI